MNPLTGIPKVYQEIKGYVSNMSNGDKVKAAVAVAICALVIGSVVALSVTMPPVTAALASLLLIIVGAIVVTVIMASLLLITIGIVALVILFLGEKKETRSDSKTIYQLPVEV